MREFFGGVKKEAKRTRWPKGKEMLKNSVICLAMIAFFALFFALFNFIFSGIGVLFKYLKGVL